MREAVGTTSIFKIVLAFTFLFVGFLAIAINYNRAYKVKNQSISIIERYEGLTNNTIKILNNYLKNSGYEDKGKCPSSVDNKNVFGSSNLESSELRLVKENEEYYYCVYYNCTAKTCTIGNNNRIKYNIRVFSKFSLPFFGSLATFKITGETKSIKLYDEAQKLK